MESAEHEERLLEAERLVRQRLGESPLDLVGDQAIANIYRASSAIRRRAEGTVLAEANVTWGGFTILFVLWVWGEMETTALAEEADLAKGTLSGMLDTLERRDLIARTRHAQDGRRIVVSLTPEGLDTIETFFPVFNGFESRMCEGLTSEEQAELSRLLRIVITNATADSAASGPATAGNGQGDG
ncbi:MAG: MarR family transcriptional regulator [Actinomycetota bacterium]